MGYAGQRLENSSDVILLTYNHNTKVKIKNTENRNANE